MNENLLKAVKVELLVIEHAAGSMELDKLRVLREQLRQIVRTLS